LYEHFSVFLGSVEQLGEVSVVWLILIAFFAPGGDGLAVEDEDVEICVEEENCVGLDARAVEEDGIGFFLVDFLDTQSALLHTGYLRSERTYASRVGWIMIKLLLQSSWLSTCL
jgi:hypothetical protein